jgi:NADH:ubiquinone oxidoreductase subunit 2 (subunit N)
VIGVVYYLRPVVYMYMFEPAAYFDEPTKHLSTRMTFFVSACLVVVTGFFASPLFAKIQTTIESIF